MTVKQTIKNNGRPVFSITGKRISMETAKAMADSGEMEFTPEVAVWFNDNYRDTAVVELTLGESEQLKQLKLKKVRLDKLIEAAGNDEDALSYIQETQEEYYALFNELNEALVSKLHEALGI